MITTTTSRVSTLLKRPFPDATVLSLDIETTGLSPHTDQIVCIAVSDGVEGIVFDVRSNLAPQGVPANWIEVSYWLLEHVYDRNLVIHNASFDLGFLRQHYAVPYPASVFDTMLAEQLLTAGLMDEKGLALSSSLKAITQRRYGIDLDKSLQTSFTMEDEITDAQAEYVLHDVIFLPQLFREQMNEMGKQKLDIVWDIERRALPVFAEMGRVGVNLDLVQLTPLKIENAAKRDALLEDLQAKLSPHVMWARIAKRDTMQAGLDEWLDRYNGRVETLEAQWIDWVFARQWEEESWYDQTIDKKDGKPKGLKRFIRARLKDWRVDNQRPAPPKLDESLINLNSQQQVLAALTELGLELPDLQTKTLQTVLVDADAHIRDDILVPLLAYKKAEKLDTSFGDPLIARIGPDGRLHGNWRQMGAATGRPTCSAPNLLQIPNDQRFRACFTAAAGKRMIVADYSQMELRLLAQASEDSVMLAAFNDGKDMHKVTAAGTFTGGDIEAVTDKQRKVAKVLNFGIIYGMGPTLLRRTLGAEGIFFTPAEARKALEGWKRTYPQANHWIEQQGNTALIKGYVATALGRRRRFDLSLATDEGERGAIRRRAGNHPIQGANADITKLAMGLIHESLNGRGVIVLQVYDEIVVEVDEEVAGLALDLVRDAMETAARTVLIDVPAAVDAIISSSWSEGDVIE